MSNVQEFPIKKFDGLNLKDAADKVGDNEFTQLQNVWQPSKGVFQGRWGTVEERGESDFALASRVSGIWRHYAASGDKFLIYHCVPDSTLLPDNTSDLVLAEVVDGLGIIFNGGAVSTVRVCYSWVGRGLEQTYNSKNRAGFPAAGSFPLDAWNNPAHQTITLSLNSSSLRVTIPAFPTGVTSANIFVSVGTSCDMTFVGNINTSSGSLVFRGLIGTNDAIADAAPVVTLDAVVGGSLSPGTYYVSAAWVIDPKVKEGDALYAGVEIPVSTAVKISLSGNLKSIKVTSPAGASSTHSAKSLYVFIGTQDPTMHNSAFVTIMNVGSATATITSMPNTNAQTAIGTNSQLAPVFNSSVNSWETGGLNVSIGSPIQSRFGFILSSKNDGDIQEIYPSRTHAFEIANRWIFTGMFQGETNNSLLAPDLHNYSPNPKTGNDRYKNRTDVAYSQPFSWSDTPGDPMFCYQLGMTYFANGSDLIWQTDGFTLGQLFPSIASALPPIPRFIFAYQQSIVISGARADSQLYQSNANAPTNWSNAGTGTLLRFVTIGDAVGSGISAQGIFTPQNDSPNSVNSFIIAFKKNGTWMIATIPDTTASSIAGIIIGNAPAGQQASPMQQVSGRVGCTAYRTVVTTPIGTMFLGQDGNVYLINSVSEPKKIGTNIQNGLSHLVSNDEYMKLCTAVYHDNHYKLSFPSVDAIAEDVVVNDSEFWADLRDQSVPWMGPHLGRNIGPQLVLVGDDDDLSRVCCDGSAVRTLTLDGNDTLADLGEDIVMKVQSKIYRLGSDGHLKRILGAILDVYIDEGYNNNILFEGFADEQYQSVNRTLSSGGAIWDVSQWDQSNYADAIWFGFAFLFGQMNLVGRTFQFRITKQDQAPFVLAAVIPQVKVEKRRTVL